MLIIINDPRQLALNSNQKHAEATSFTEKNLKTNKYPHNLDIIQYLISISAYFNHTVILRWSTSKERSQIDLALS